MVMSGTRIRLRERMRTYRCRYCNERYDRSKPNCPTCKTVKGMRGRGGHRPGSIGGFG